MRTVDLSLRFSGISHYVFISTVYTKQEKTTMISFNQHLSWRTILRPSISNENEAKTVNKTAIALTDNVVVFLQVLSIKVAAVSVSFVIIE